MVGTARPGPRSEREAAGPGGALRQALERATCLTPVGEDRLVTREDLDPARCYEMDPDEQNQRRRMSRPRRRRPEGTSHEARRVGRAGHPRGKVLGENGATDERTSSLGEEARPVAKQGTLAERRRDGEGPGRKISKERGRAIDPLRGNRAAHEQRARLRLSATGGRRVKAALGARVTLGTSVRIKRKAREWGNGDIQRWQGNRIMTNSNPNTSAQALI